MKFRMTLCMKRIIALLLLLALSGCGGGSTPYDFISLKGVDDTVTINMKMSHDEIMGALSARYGTIGMEQNAGVHLKWKNDQIVSIQMIAKIMETSAGIVAFDNNKTQALDAYAKDPDVKVIENGDQKVILGKQIDGVNYTLTFRLYPNGDIKTITLTNADEYTENEADFQ